jgi:para-aminobenzoate synthetase component I
MTPVLRKKRMTSKRIFSTFPVDNIGTCKTQLLSWVNRFGSCCFLDNHAYAMPGGHLECLAGAGELAVLSIPAGDALGALEAFHREQGDWLFGHLGYDLKNETEGLLSGLPDPLDFPDLRFFVPRYVFLLTGGALSIGTLEGDDPGVIWEEVRGMPEPEPVQSGMGAQRMGARFTREAYLDTVRSLQKHIQRGDCYEVTFCQEFFMEDAEGDPVSLYRALESLSPQPHSAYYAFGDHYLLCASPERYLQHQDGRLLSQPIKGTARRRPDNPSRDRQLREDLLGSGKERSENVMIVDLVRNDLSRVCAEGSVRVPELFGIYAFPQVYQMISSVEGFLAPGRSWVDALRATFPMGSMTGAPKRRVLELIEQYERTRRGLYSGAVGYIDPEGNFDFAVVIRSILYNKARRYLSFSVGSAITAASDPAREYSECLLKARAIKKALEKVSSAL